MPPVWCVLTLCISILQPLRLLNNMLFWEPFSLEACSPAVGWHSGFTLSVLNSVCPEFLFCSVYNNSKDAAVFSYEDPVPLMTLQVTVLQWFNISFPFWVQHCPCCHALLFFPCVLLPLYLGWVFQVKMKKCIHFVPVSYCGFAQSEENITWSYWLQ